MSNANDRKVVLITRQTRIEELTKRYHTLAQAKFYIEHLGADFSDYLKESEAYSHSLRIVVEALQGWGRYHILDRSLVPNYTFGPDDIIVTLGQDGLVANTIKYLQGHPVIGINPEPTRWDGVLLPFEAQDLQKLLPQVAHEKRENKAISMAQANLSDGQVLLAVNDFFIGPKTHSSALYEIELRDKKEFQSSSGIIVSTGLGSTAWFKSVVTGSMAIYNASKKKTEKNIASTLTKSSSLKTNPKISVTTEYEPLPWDAAMLKFAVREPFPSRSSQASLVYGEVDINNPLTLRSHMAEDGIIFSDGMQRDYMEFNAGVEAVISLSKQQGQLII